MKTFEVYKHPIYGLETIKAGFSFPAFFFGWIWMFIKKLWGLGFLFLFLQFLIVGFDEMATAALEVGEFGMSFFVLACYMTVLVTAGINGNKWWAAALLKRGFTREDTIQASNKDAALALYVNELENRSDS
jgi:hypothetical protein